MTQAPADTGFVASVRAFAQSRIAPAAAGWSMGDSPDPALLREAAALGLTGLEVPTALGGLGLGFGLKAQLCSILAEADFGFAMSLVNSHNVGLRLCESAPPALRDAFLPGILAGRISACTALSEPGAGSDFAAITTRARPHGSGWSISGEKTWIVNGRYAGVAVVFAQTADIGDAAGIGAFLVDLERDSVRRHAIDSGFSQTSIGTGGFVLEDVRIPQEALLLPPGGAFKSILTEINAARTYVAAMCNGMLRAALSEVTAYGAQRHSFGKPLNAHPSWSRIVARASADLDRAEALTRAATARIDAGEDAQLAAAEAKIHGALTCQHRLPELLHAMGAEGLRPERCFTRHLAAAQIAGLADGATTLLQDRVARLTGQPAPDPKV